MGRSPPLAPSEPHTDATIHIVLDDFGDLGRAYRETDENEADAGTIIDNIMRGEYSRPIRVLAINLAEQSARDVSREIAWAVAERARNEGRELGKSARQFVEWHLDRSTIG